MKRCETFSVIYNKTEEQTKDRIFSNININDEDNDDNCVINYRINENKMIFIMILFKNLKQTSTFFVKYIDPLSFWLVQSHKGINNMHGKLSEFRQQTNQTSLMKSAI